MKKVVKLEKTEKNGLVVDGVILWSTEELKSLLQGDFYMDAGVPSDASYHPDDGSGRHKQKRR